VARERFSDDGRDSYGNGTAPDDDLVLALAIAVYATTQRTGGARMTHAGLDASLQAAARHDDPTIVGAIRRPAPISTSGHGDRRPDS